MKRVVGIVTAPWFFALIGAILLALVIWFAGPLLGFGNARPLESVVVRAILVGLILLAWLAYAILSVLRRRRREKGLVDAIATDAAADQGAGAAEDEVAALRERLDDAMGQLKRFRSQDGKSGGRFLYELPWYIVIGPPGAGKTTALVNSGLKFPLAERFGKGAVRGAGGTRNCDWWFTDQAVLIDTAGRYTTQDSARDVDEAGWRGFLQMLRKTRPRQPINGAVVAISLADLVTLGEADRRAHAAAVRLRVRELQEQLGVRFPIYVLFTKADLIAGFVEFFDDLGREGREQVWGATFPATEKGAGAPAVDLFDGEFDLLMRRVEARVLPRLQAERDAQRRALIFGFPTQLGSLRDAMRDFLDEAFRPTRYDDEPLLRGFYFTSGTQEGTPIDRIMGALSRQFGIGRRTVAAGAGGGRSYFLTALLRDVVFSEASLVGRNPSAERRGRMARRLAVAASLLVLVAAGGLWALSAANNRALVDRLQAGLDGYGDDLAAFDATTVDSADLRPILPALDRLRDLPTGYDDRDRPVPLASTFGLYQGRKLEQVAVSAYRDGLTDLLLPRLVFRLEEQLRAINDPQVLYEALKVYLMLGGQGPLDDRLVRQWLAIDIDSRYPGPGAADLRDGANAHVAALLETPVEPPQLDGDLVARTRAILERQPLAERAYALVTRSRAATALPEWRPVDVAGTQVTRVFARASGRAMTEGIEGIYTYDGFHDVFLPAVGDVTRSVAEDGWVLGREQEALSGDELDRLENDLLALYYADYINRWDGFLNDLTLVPLDGPAQAAEVVNILSAPNSPLRSLLASVADQTRLARPEEQGEAAAALEQAGEAAGAAREAASVTGVGRSSTSNVDRIITALSGGAAGGPGRLPGQFVNDHFANLHDLVLAPDGGTAPIDDILRMLDDVYGELNRVARNGGDFQGDAARRVETAASRAPAPLAGLLDQVASGATSIASGDKRQQINELWRADVAPLCQRALAGRYPVANASAEVTLDDFSRLFAPNGLIDGFFQQHLRPFVDMSSTPWQWQSFDGIELGISPGVLAQFERAEKIRDAFFPSGGGRPSVSFEMTPVSLDANATQVLVEIDGQSVTYAHGPPVPSRLQWPGPGGGRARVAFQGPGVGGATGDSIDGTWAFFRLLDRSRVVSGGSRDRFQVTFGVAGATATFDVTAGSVMSPFNLPELRSFSCPGSL